MTTPEDVGVYHEIISYSLCRFCAKEIDKKELIDLKLEIIQSKYIKLLSFLKLDVDLSDGNKLPKYACLECHIKCMDCYYFFSTIENSQKKLKKLFNDDKDSIETCSEVADPTENEIKSELLDNSPVHSNIALETNDEREPDANAMKNSDFINVMDTEDMVEENIDKISNNDMNITYLYKEEIYDDNPHFSDDVTADDGTNCHQVTTPTDINQSTNKTDSNDDFANSITNPKSTNTPFGTVSMYFIDYNTENNVKTTEIRIDDQEFVKSIENLIISKSLEKDSNNVEIKDPTNEVVNTCSTPNNDEAESDVTVIDKENYLETSKESNLPNESASFDIETVENCQSNNELEANTSNLNVDNTNTDSDYVINDSDDSMSLSSSDGSWNDYPWFCIYCNEEFDCMNDLREHSKNIHNRCYAFKCYDCRDDFNIFNIFVEHVRTHRQYLRLYCQYCNQKFDDKTKCFEHALSHWTASEKICNLCGEIFQDQQLLTSHNKLYKNRSLSYKMTNRTPEVMYEISDLSWKDYEWSCMDCFRVLPDVQSLRVHAREVHGKCFAMKCADCLLFRNDYFTLVRHIRRHRPYLSNFCEYCDQYVSDAGELKAHVDSHYQRENPCYGCGEIFETKELLQKHIIDFTATTRYKLFKDEISFSCEICSKRFPKLCNLNTHKAIHNKKNFVCEYCGNVYRSEYQVIQHLAVHNKSEKHMKTHKCEICNRLFKTTRALTFHARRHLQNDKPYICDICGKSFKSKDNVKYHINAHLNIKPHVCVVCNKGFQLKNVLKVHYNQHTGLKPVKCGMCDRTFTNSSNCNKHMIRIHGVPLFKSKYTPHGKFAIDQATGEVANVSMDDKAIEWLNKVTTKKKKRK